MKKSELFIDEFLRLKDYLQINLSRVNDIKQQIQLRGHDYYGITRSVMISRGWHSYIMLDIWEDKLIERQFLFAFYRKNQSEPVEFVFVEVLRKILGNNYIHESDVFYNTLAGNKIICFNDERFTYVNRNWKKCFAYLADTKYDYETLEPYYDKFNIRYSQYENPLNRSGIPRISYLTRFINQPRIELLVKNGYSHLITETRYMNLKSKSIDHILKIKNKRLLKQVLNGDMSLSTARYRQTLIDKYSFESFDQIDCYGEAIKKFNDKDFLKKNAKHIINYLIDLRNYKKLIYTYCLSDYYDYIQNAIKLNINLEEKKHLCPPFEDFDRLHDEYAKRVEKIKIHDIDLKLMDVAKKVENLTLFNSDQFVLLVPKSVRELKKEGKTLNHCVATYSDRIIRGETTVLFLRKCETVDIPYYTIELKKKKIVQIRGKNNSDIKDDKVYDFIKSWCNKLKLKNEVFI